MFVEDLLRSHVSHPCKTTEEMNKSYCRCFRTLGQEEGGEVMGV